MSENTSGKLKSDRQFVGDTIMNPPIPGWFYVCKVPYIAALAWLVSVCPEAQISASGTAQSLMQMEERTFDIHHWINKLAVVVESTLPTGCALYRENSVIYLIKKVWD